MIYLVHIVIGIILGVAANKWVSSQRKICLSLDPYGILSVVCIGSTFMNFCIAKSLKGVYIDIFVGLGIISACLAIGTMDAIVENELRFYSRSNPLLNQLLLKSWEIEDVLNRWKTLSAEERTFGVLGYTQQENERLEAQLTKILEQQQKILWQIEEAKKQRITEKQQKKAFEAAQREHLQAEKLAYLKVERGTLLSVPSSASLEKLIKTADERIENKTAITPALDIPIPVVTRVEQNVEQLPISCQGN